MRLRLNSSQRITARSIFTKYNQLRRTSEIIKSNEENGIGFKSKKRRRNLTQHMYGCEIIPPPQIGHFAPFLRKSNGVISQLSLIHHILGHI